MPNIPVLPQVTDIMSRMIFTPLWLLTALSLPESHKAVKKRITECTLASARSVCDKPLKYGKPVWVSPDKQFPFGHTPSEILVIIFFYCLPGADDRGLTLVPTVLFELSSVCRLWRDVIQRTPTLWSCISITCSPRHAGCNVGAPLLPTILERSGVCPLQISIRGAEPRMHVIHETRHNSGEPATAFWQTISGQLSRCDRLALKVYDSTHPIVLSLPPIVSTSRLKHFKISLRSSTARFPTQVADYIKRSGTLRTLMWDTPGLEVSVLLRKSNWPSLTSLHIRSSLLINEDFVNALLVAPNLIICDLATITLGIDDLALNSTPLIHKALRDLKLKSLFIFSAFISSISLPTLETLELQASTEFGLQVGLIQEFPAFHTRDFCWPSLTTLHINAPGQLASEDCFSVLKSAPLLESCSIKVLTNDLTTTFAPFVHRSLRILAIETKTILSAFLRSVSFPNLESLQMEATSRSAVTVTHNRETHALPDLIGRCRPPLRRLVLENLSLPQRGLIDCLRSVPSLTHLEVHEDFEFSRQPGLTALIVSALSDRLDADHRLCPRLKVIRLTGNLMIRIRRDVGCLERVQVEFGPLLHPMDEVIFKELQRNGLKITWLPRSGM
ncbi:hypothetical protein BDZ97DRAFT_1867110 [Flammula alnicola]|nr:hypothetical protein BDZ97DRAFT_1867110 [Flammula alnicola]